jgi:hypothetical protein
VVADCFEHGNYSRKNIQFGFSRTLRLTSSSAETNSSRFGELTAEMKKGELSFAFLMLAERTGLEPATPGVTGRYSNQLNYHSIVPNQLHNYLNLR